MVVALTACAAPVTAGPTPAGVTASTSVSSPTPSPVGTPTPASALPTPVVWQTVEGVPASAECPPSGLVAGFGASDAAMGLRVVALELVNCGTRPRRVKGYPVVKVFDKDQQPLPFAVTHGRVLMADPDPGPKVLVLAPGERAEAMLSWRNTVTLDLGKLVVGEYASIAAAPGQPFRSMVQHVDPGTTGKIAVTAWYVPSP
jgi:Protein of unknown function (DUF4232)